MSNKSKLFSNINFFVSQRLEENYNNLKNSNEYRKILSKYAELFEEIEENLNNEKITNEYKEIEANLHTLQLEEAYKLGFKDSLKITNI